MPAVALGASVVFGVLLACALTDRLAGALAGGETFTHEADHILTVTIDSLGSNAHRIAYRRLNDLNKWQTVVGVTGNVILSEWVGGTDTTRASSGVGTVSGGERYDHTAVDEAITAYIDDSQIFTYGSAANFKTETGGEVDAVGTGGSMSDLETRPHSAPCLSAVGL